MHIHTARTIPFRSRYEDMIKDYERKQDSQAEKLQKMQADYQQAVGQQVTVPPKQP